MEKHYNWTNPLNSAQHQVRLMYIAPECYLAIPNYGTDNNSLCGAGGHIHAYVSLQKLERSVLEASVDVYDMFDTGRGSQLSVGHVSKVYVDCELTIAGLQWRRSSPFRRSPQRSKTGIDTRRWSHSRSDGRRLHSVGRRRGSSHRW